MMRIFIALFVFFLIPLSAVLAADVTVVPERILGKATAPVTVEEFVSLTCSHCAHFYSETLPELEAKYVDTGKVRFILRDFPMDGVALKAAALARCMPEEQYYPFIKVLYKTQKDWSLNPDPQKLLIQYARLGGLDEAKAKSCLDDEKMIGAIIKEDMEATQKLKINATPTYFFRLEGRCSSIPTRSCWCKS